LFSTARWRLALWFAGVFAVLLVLIGSAVFFSTRATLLAQVNDDLATRSNRVVAAAGSPGGVFNLTRPGAFNQATSGGYFYKIITPEGGGIFASDGAPDQGLPDGTEIARRTADGPQTLEVRGASGERLRVRIRTEYDQFGRAYYFSVGRSIQPEIDALRRLAFLLVFGGIAGLALAGAAGYWLAGRALKPIQTAMTAQRTFVADASHEIRTPLTLIRANAEVLKRQTGDPPDQTLVDDIIRESDRLTYLVGQMLTLARSDSAGVKLEKGPVQLGVLAEDIARQMRLLATEKNISITVDAAPDAIAEGDEQRLGELLIILLDNAIKYSDDGAAVSVRAARDGTRVRLTVSDTGRGIEAAALPHVFDRFYRADKARSREQGGTGLGLAIARWIVDQHGGQISLDSSPGRGTSVTVELPGLSADEIGVGPEETSETHEIAKQNPETEGNPGV
jgi:signal transduction histidine kinase